MRRLSCLAACLLLAGCITNPFGASGDGPSLSPEGQDAYHVLRDADFFSSGCVGFACVPPPTVEAFRVLIEDPGADAAFKSLLDEASLAGQLYALAGVYYTDADRFGLYAAPYRRTSKKVEYWSGCIGGRSAVRDLVTEIASGDLPRSIRGY